MQFYRINSVTSPLQIIILTSHNMFKGVETSFELSKALEFVGDNSTYQKNRLLYLSLTIFSCAALSSYIPIILPSYQSTLFYIFSAAGQLICPMYFEIKTTVKYLIFTSIIACISLKLQWTVLEVIAFSMTGFLGRGLYVDSFIYLNEIGGEKFRAWSFMVIFTLTGLAPFSLAILSMFKLSPATTILLILLLPNAILLYFMRNNNWHVSPIKCCEIFRDFNQARVVLNVIANENGRPEFNNMLEGEDTNDILIEHKKYTHFDLFFLKTLKAITVPLALLWFYREFIYYGSIVVVPMLGEQKSKNLILLSVSEVVAALMSVPIKLRVKRINAFFGFSALIAVICIFVSFFKIPTECFPKGEDCYQKYIYRSMSMIIRFSISLIGSIIMNYTIEVYPTKVRNLGFGVCLAAGSVGSISMSVLVDTLTRVGLSPFVPFAVISILIVYWIPRLPETHGKITTQRVSEIEGSNTPIIGFN